MGRRRRFHEVEHAPTVSPWRMNRPITSCPAWRSKWAATLLSTPPDMANTTRTKLVSLSMRPNN